MTFLIVMHRQLANSVVIFMLIVGVWGLWNFFRRKPVTPSYFGSLVIGEILVVAQVLAGIVLYVTGLRAAGLIHYLYGVLALIALPAAFAYVQGDTSRRASLVYSLVCLFIFGLGIRAIITAAFR